MIFNKGTKTTTQWEKYCVFNKMVLGNLDIHMQKNERRPVSYTICNTNINSKRIEDLKRRLKSIKLIEENKGEKLYDIGLDDDFVDMTDNKRKADIWDYIKLKNFCALKDTVNSVESN